MRVRTVLILIGSAVFCVAVGPLVQLQAQLTPAATWVLPHGLSVKDAGPRTYKFVVDYNTANSKGEIVQRQRLVGEYTRGLPGREVMWKNVTHTTGQGESAPFGAPQRVDFMEGFRYRNDLDGTMAPDFFKGFPATAVMERNLVWDTGMIEMFGQNYFDRLKLNVPYQAISNLDTDIPGVGKFHSRDVVLQWVGRSQRNGQECAVIQY